MKSDPNTRFITRWPRALRVKRRKPFAAAAKKNVGEPETSRPTPAATMGHARTLRLAR